MLSEWLHKVLQADNIDLRKIFLCFCSELDYTISENYNLIKEMCVCVCVCVCVCILSQVTSRKQEEQELGEKDISLSQTSRETLK